jgi:hypothetical protein
MLTEATGLSERDRPFEATSRSSRFPRTDRFYVWLCQTHIAPSLLRKEFQQLGFVDIDMADR